ncbi:MAG: glutamine--fructose-6-phosphate transaminase (isomerizing) [Nitrospiraceae bacterium]|nr:glutamine--fructose-6-phosphate transaminase (isomerizing) [Nitrospiraceae bacterium]
MCGIIGYIGPRNAVSITLEGLKRLEYRGYDSAGIALLEGGGIKIIRCAGKIRQLEGLLGEKGTASARLAIGHTRWATHGGPSEKNAHPHKSGGIVLVHNGIVENYISLKRGLEAEGCKFNSETDTEVICHLVNKYSKALPFEEAVMAAVKDLKGAYALAILSEKEPQKIIGVRKDSPLVFGVGDGEYFLSSDAAAFLNYTKRAIFLEDDQIVVVSPDGYRIMSADGSPVEKNPQMLLWSAGAAEKDGYKHFMLKEIHEQPRAISDTIRGRLDAETGEVNLEEFGLTEDILKKTEKVIIASCGTSWHAGLAARYIMEPLALVPVEVDIASEFRYRKPVVKGSELFIAITQSGETADTLAALRLAKSMGARTLSITNVIGSTAARDADSVFFTRSGPEIGVASTKTFTTQLVSLYMLGIAFARAKGAITADQSKALLGELLSIPEKIELILKEKEKVEEIARGVFKKKDFLFLGRGINYPIALEGALKLKEISYIHAEGYPAGEMKHGPIALIDEDMPVLFLLPTESFLREKIVSNMEEVRSRRASLILITDGQDEELERLSTSHFSVPGTNEFLTAVLMAVPLQLLAYYIGVLRGCDVDQPRNLAKSVTVE